VERLEKSATDVAGKQIAALEEAGAKVDASIDFEDLKSNPQGLKVIEATLQMRMPAGNGAMQNPRKRQFIVEALTYEQRRKEVRLKMVVTTPRDGGADEIYSVFWVGFFDFPMVDNVRLSNGDRCAIVLSRFQKSSAQITLVYFPATRSSVKDKPYYDEVLSALLRSNQQRP
jgi:hypothetical protein